MDLKIDYLYYGKNLKNYDMPIKTNLNDNVKIHYSLFLENGKKIETPYDKISFYFQELGYSNDFEDIDENNNGTIIKGLDKVITGLTLGDFIRVKIPYEYAYGENGMSYLIPKKSNLIYYLQLIYIERNDNIFKYPNIINLNKIVKIDDINKIKENIL
jgi:FKBP-type peptidyl-prolyl cis-trans isomerase